MQARKPLQATQLTSKALPPHGELSHEESPCPLQSASFSLQNLHPSDYAVALLLTTVTCPATSTHPRLGGGRCPYCHPCSQFYWNAVMPPFVGCLWLLSHSGGRAATRSQRSQSQRDLLSGPCSRLGASGELRRSYAHSPGHDRGAVIKAWTRDMEAPRQPGRTEPT